MNNFTEEQLEILAQESMETLKNIQSNRLEIREAVKEVTENIANNADRFDGILVIALSEPGKKLGIKEDGEFRATDMFVHITAINGTVRDCIMTKALATVERERNPRPSFLNMLRG